MINRAWRVNCETSYILALFIYFFSCSYQTSAATPQTLCQHCSYILWITCSKLKLTCTGGAFEVPALVLFISLCPVWICEVAADV